MDFKLKDGIEKNQDLLDYATTALELNAYDFSAHLFWFLNKDLKSDFKKIDLYAYFLYALKGLENTSIDDIFKDKKNQVCEKNHIFLIKSIILFEYPHSLSYQHVILANFPLT